MELSALHRGVDDCLLAQLAHHYAVSAMCEVIARKQKRFVS